MLTDTSIRKTKPAQSIVKLTDGGGLHLWITPGGGRHWRMAYRFAGKQRVLVIGVYPATTLKAARIARDRAKEALAAGVVPSQKKKLDRIAVAAVSVNTFAALSEQLLAKKAKEGKAEVAIGKLRWILDFAKHDLGPRPIASITPPEVARHAPQGRGTRQARDRRSPAGGHRAGVSLRHRHGAGG
jgi:hypothetical protein